MRTEAITDPGFEHDIMAATFVLFLTSPAYAELAKDLAQHGFELCHASYPTAVVRPDGSHTVLSMDRTTLIASTHRNLAVLEKMEPSNAMASSEKVMAAAESAAMRLIAFDMETLATDHASVVSASLLGALAGAKVLPFERKQFESARGIRQRRQSLACCLWRGF